MARWPYCTSQWQRLRSAKLDECPICLVCEKCAQTVLATTVDHVIPISQGGAPFPALSGLMALCERCHNEKHLALIALMATPRVAVSKAVMSMATPLIRQMVGGVGGHEITRTSQGLDRSIRRVNT